MNLINHTSATLVGFLALLVANPSMAEEARVEPRYNETDPAVVRPGDKVRLVVEPDSLTAFTPLVGPEYWDVYELSLDLTTPEGKKVAITEVASHRQAWSDDERKDPARMKGIEVPLWVDFRLPADDSLYGAVLSGDVKARIAQAVPQHDGRLLRNDLQRERSVRFKIGTREEVAEYDASWLSRDVRAFGEWALAIAACGIGLVVIRLILPPYAR